MYEGASECTIMCAYLRLANGATTMVIVSVLSAVALIVALIVLSAVALTGSETIAEGFLGRNCGEYIVQPWGRVTTETPG